MTFIKILPGLYYLGNRDVVEYNINVKQLL